MPSITSGVTSAAGSGSDAYAELWMGSGMGGANASARNANSAPSATDLDDAPTPPAGDRWCRTLRHRCAARKPGKSTEEAARMGTTKKSTDQNRVAKGLSAATRSLLVSSVLYVSLSSGDATDRCIDGASRG